MTADGTHEPSPPIDLGETIGRLVAERPAVDDEALLARATAAFVDTLGVMLAGAAEPATAIALRVARTQFAGAAPTVAPTATPALATDQPLSAAGAAFVNGVAAHALDFDDVSSAVSGHPSAVLVPTLLALAEASGASGRDVLDAYLVGIHVSSAVGAGFDLRASYARGWHLTSVLGALGAAAAGARLRGLDADRTRCAVSIAGSITGGSRASFGTMVKPLHVGMTAAQAILAVELAAADLTANPSLVDAPLGFLALHAESPIDEAAAQRELDGPLGQAVRRLDVKLYPCCYHTHRMIDAALAVRSPLADTQDVERVRVTTAPGGTAALLYHWPRTPTEARFSAEYTVATALVDGVMGEASFGLPVLERTNVRDLMKRIEVDELDTPPAGPSAWTDSYAVVEIEWRDGRVDRKRVDAARGAHAAPATDEELAAKFVACAARHPAGSVAGPRALSLVTGMRDDDAGTLLRRVLATGHNPPR